MSEPVTPVRPSLAKFGEICGLVLNFTKTITSSVISSAAVLIAVWFVIVTLRPNPPVLIGELNIPPPLQQQGYTPEVVARRMLDEISRLRDSPNIDGGDHVTYENAPSKPPPNLHSLGGMSLASVEYALQGVFGRKPAIVQGELISSTQGQQGTRHEGRLRLGSKVLSERESAPGATSPDKLIQHLAFDLYRYFDPLHAAIAAWNNGDLEDMRLAIRQLLSSPNREDRQNGLMMRSFIVSPALAEADLQEAIRLDPNFVQALTLLSGYERRRGAYVSAREHAERAIHAAPDRGLGYYVKGRLERAEGRLDDALATFKQACRREPRLAACPNQLGEVLLEMSLRPDAPKSLQRSAYEHFLQASKIDSTYPSAVANAAWAAASFGDLSEALALANAAIDMAPSNALYRLRQAWILKRQGNDADGREAFRQALRLNPNALTAPVEQPWDHYTVREVSAYAESDAK